MEKSNNTRLKILVAAEDIFARDGYHRASLKEIAAVVGIKEPSLFYYFKNKEDIFLNVIDVCFHRFDDFFIAHTQNFHQGDKLGTDSKSCPIFLQDYIYNYLNFSQQKANILNLYSSGISIDERIKDYIKEKKVKIINHFYEVYKMSITMTCIKISDEECRERAGIIVAMLDGLIGLKNQNLLTGDLTKYQGVITSMLCASCENVD